MIKFLLKRKIENLYAVEVVHLDKKTIKVKSTDKSTVHLDKGRLKSLIMMECDQEVTIL